MGVVIDRSTGPWQGAVRLSGVRLQPAAAGLAAHCRGGTALPHSASWNMGSRPEVVQGRKSSSNVSSICINLTASKNLLQPPFLYCCFYVKKLLQITLTLFIGFLEHHDEIPQDVYTPSVVILQVLNLPRLWNIWCSH